MHEHEPTNENNTMSGAAEAEPDSELEPIERPRIYVASLSDYNHGILHGRWIDASSDPEAMQAQIDAMLSASPTTRQYGDVAEEWAIHDFDGFDSIRVGEHTALSTIARLAEGMERHGAAFAAWVAYVGETSADLIEQFEDRYHGQWESVEAYAEELLGEMDAERYVREAPEWLQPHLKLDVEGFARDLELGGNIVAIEKPDGGVWVFTA